MVQAGASIEAFLKLNATGFKTGIETSIEAVAQFKKTLVEIGKDSKSAELGFQALSRAISNLANNIQKLSNLTKAVQNFKTLAQGMEYAATAAQRLTTVAQRGGVGIEALNSIIGTWKAGMESATINVNGLASAMRVLNEVQGQSRTFTQAHNNELWNLRNNYTAMRNTLLSMGEALNNEANAEVRVRQQTQSMRTEFEKARADMLAFANGGVEAFNSIRASSDAVRRQVQMMETEFERSRAEMLKFANGGVEAFNKLSRSSSQFQTKINPLKMSLIDLWNVYARGNSIINPTVKSIQMQNSALEKNRQEVMALITGQNQETASLERNSIATRQNAEAKLRAMGYTGKLTIEEEKETASVNKNTTSHYRNASAMSQSTARSNQLASATSRLSKAMSSLRMIGSLVGSMLAYNFAHKLLVATGETIHAKSEMEGYFKMLNFGQRDIDGFNKALDETVHQFQRVNKYSLGETISSIGVEFNLSTEEMKKAMKVTSMITSEYLRAGRNANEASLAVKDVLQGQFQRLSRETGVKGEQLKDAGWSGDTTDVLGLMEALEKVGKSRNWDVFAEKANSLNDILTISQNRFGEWSADLVNVVQPAILSTFNSFMSFSQGVAQGLSSVWEWLNTDGWSQTAVKIGLVGTALLTLSQAFASYRTGMSMVQMANMGFTKTLTSVIFGLKGQQMAEVGVRNAILSKIIGVNAEAVAEGGLASAIAQANTMTQLETVQNRLNTLSSKENSVAKMENAIQTDIEKAKKEGLITVEEADTLRKELNTAMTEANALASLKQAGVNGTLTTTFIALGGAENIAAVATGEISVAMGVLNGVFALSPIGWFMGAVLALAGAFYVLSGGLDKSWDQMKKFNETMQNAGDEQKKAQQYLADLKKEVGENSQAYKDAKKSVEEWKGELQSASYWMNDANKKFEEMNFRMSAGSKPILRDMGMDEKEIEKFDADLDHLILGKNKYYKAEQVLNAQLYNEHSNYNEDLKEYLGNVKKNGGDLEEAYEKMSGNYANLAEHSYIANTTDDWWEWMWNSLYAGMDQFWIDWDKFWANPNWEGAINGLWKGLKSANPFGGILKNLGLDNFDLGKSLSETLKGLGDWVNGVGDAWNKFWADLDLAGAINNAWSGFSDWVQQSIDTYIVQPFSSLGDRLMECINNIASYDYIGEFLKTWGLEDFDLGEMITGWFSNDSNGMKQIDTSFITNIARGIADAIINFDWIGTMSSLVETSPLMTIINSIFGTDGMDFTSVWEWVQLNIITPISTTIQTFLADPVAFIGNMGFTISGLLDGLFGTDIFTNVMSWVNSYIITPFGTAIYNGIMSIPILGDILTMLGFTDQAQGTSSSKGEMLARAMGNAITTVIGQIPILGDILRLLGLIPQANPTASANGQSLGDSIRTGFRNKVNGMAQIVRDEIGHIITAIQNKIDEVGKVASDLGNAVVNGVKNAIDPGSPGIIARSIIGNEFGIYIPQKIADGMDLAYSTAQSYGQQIKDGISSVNLNSFGSFATDYEADTQMINASTEMMGIDTTTAFNNMSSAVNSTTNTMGSNVVSTYSTMQTKQQSSLQSMKQQNVSAYNDMYLKSNQSLIQMRDSTSNITHQMTNAWNTMKNNIVASANQLKHDSTVHFNTLSNTIGSFYRKIQNPSSWGAGTGSSRPVRTSRNPSIGRRVGHALHGAGTKGDKYHGSSTMTISQLKKQLCPNGECANLFDGYSATDRVDVQAFLNSITGEHGFGGWGDWHGTHYNYIKTKSDAWSMKSPTINLAGGIPTNADYKVGDFENGSPKISFGAFQSMAESIFSAIPYRHYMDSSWKGSWLGALQAGACNCSDGADALIAFAGACGFGGSKVHGTWDGEGHFWAVINGKPMDTTAWQKGYGWTSPKVHGYGMPKTRTAVPHDNNQTTNNNASPTIVVNINEPVYGIDDLDSKISDSIDKGLAKHFNKNYAIGV